MVSSARPNHVDHSDTETQSLARPPGFDLGVSVSLW